MSVYKNFVSRALFPAHEYLKRHSSLKVRRSLEETQWWSRQRIDELRLQGLKQLLAYATRHVPYYRNRVDFDPSRIESLDDLQRVPMLTKADIRARAQDLRADIASDLIPLNTGGSTGEPLRFYVSRERVSHDIAAKWRATRWWDVDIGDREMVIWGSPIELSSQDLLRRVRDRILRTELLSAFELSETTLDRYVARIREIRPAMLFGYPSAIARLAAHAEANRIDVASCGIRVVFCTAERLYDEQRAIIERVFRSRVANGYGGRDMGFIAHECPRGGMHISAEHVIVETVDSDGDAVPAGQPGEIVVTHLCTREFPFIRYRTGDVGILDETTCACGRGLPLIKELHGRSTDFVTAHDGTVMHGLSLIYVLRDLPGIAAFKIIQETRDLTRVQVVPVEGFNDAVISQIQHGLKARLGSAVEIRVESAAALPPEKSGKYRYVISRLAA